MTKTQANEPGFVLVPREPTEAMGQEGAHEFMRLTGALAATTAVPTMIYRAMLAAAPIVPAPAYGVKELPDHVAQHYGDLGFRIVEFFDKDETAGSFLREDGDGGFVGGLYRMAREIDALRTGATHTALETAPVEEADAKAGEPGNAETAVAVALQLAMVLEDCEVWVNAAGRSLSARMNGPAMAQTIRDVALYAAPPAPTIPSEPEAKGEAGAGPVGEAVAWCAHPDQTSPMTVGPESFLEEPDAILTALDLAIEWLEIDPVAEERGVVERIKDARRVYARPVDEPGEVERLTRERDEAREELAMIAGRHKAERVACTQLNMQFGKRAETAEAALAAMTLRAEAAEARLIAGESK